jgi:AcrR family transcriptional regulator
MSYAAAVTADLRPGAPPAPPPPPPPGPAGLRERKKLATRQALSQAAMRLAIERGLDNLLVEDIAAAAQVSPRTFNNYFASKYEAICALALDRSLRVGEALRERPAAEPLWDAIRAAVLAVYASADQAPDPAVLSGIRLVVSSPALRGEYLKVLAITQYDLAHAITERTGGQPGADAYSARGLASAVISVVQAATERWLFADPPVAMAALVGQALTELAGGLLAVLPSPASHEHPPCHHPPPHNAPPQNPVPPVPAPD